MCPPLRCRTVTPIRPTLSPPSAGFAQFGRLCHCLNFALRARSDSVNKWPSRPAAGPIIRQISIHQDVVKKVESACSAACSPNSVRSTTAATTTAMRIPPSALLLKLSSNSSKTKVIAAIGALNAAEMPAPMPTGIIACTRSLPSPNSLPSFDETALQICTVGPSRPRLLPKATEMVPIMKRQNASEVLMTPKFW